MADTSKISQEAREAFASVCYGWWRNLRADKVAEFALEGRLDNDELVQAFQRAMNQAAEAAAKDMRERCAKVAEAHKPSRTKPLGAYDPEDREIIRAEENGEAIAASCISAAIRSLPLEGKGLR